MPTAPPTPLEELIRLLREAQFVRGVATLDALPVDRALEVAFAGRSNAGKSSAINTLTGRNALARVSKTPGRTQQINFFALDERRRLVDLPGYGFARAPERVKRDWSALVEGYLHARRCLAGLVLLTDSRRPLTPLDRQLVAWAAAARVPLWCLLTKADKLGRGAGARALTMARRELHTLAPDAGLQLFSATQGTGLDLLRQRLGSWLDLPMEAPPLEVAAGKKGPRLPVRGGKG